MQGSKVFVVRVSNQYVELLRDKHGITEKGMVPDEQCIEEQLKVNVNVKKWEINVTKIS